MHDFGLNVPSVGPLSKPNPASPYLQVCPTEADQPNTCVPLKLGGAGSSGNGLIGKLNSLVAFSKPDSDHQHAHVLTHVGKSQVQSNFSFNFTNSEIKPAFSDVEVEVQLTESILNLGKHSAIIFRKIPNSPDHTKGRSVESLVQLVQLIRTEKLMVSLVDSMEEVVKLISSELTNEVEMG
ncbi:hypothetical protein Gotri_005496, partial [Gossypium trilobum]|nr:hypothetical protein [Gossypium trilobum]